MENRNSYTEQLKLEVIVDKSEMQKIKDDFESIHIGGISKKEQNALKESYETHQQNLKKIAKINADIAKLQDIHSKESNKVIKDLEKAKRELMRDLTEDKRTALNDSLSETVQKKLGDLFETVGRKTVEFINDIKNRAFEMMDTIASYSMNSRVYSSEATQLKLSYGLTSGQAYAAQMASSQTGFGSFTDYLQNQMFATKETKEEWQKLYKQYEKSYEQDEKIALEFQSFKKDWTNMKNELARDVIHFFMENKDTIKAALQGILVIAKAVTSFLAAFLSIFGSSDRTEEERAASTNDIISSYLRTYNNSNVSVNQTNNYNVDSNTARALTEANNKEYLQTIAGITGGAH